MSDPVLTGVVLATAVVGELLPLPRVSGRSVPTSVAVIGTYALLGAPAWAVVGAAVGARIAGALIKGEPDRLSPRRLLGTAGAAGVAAGAVRLGELLAPWSIAPSIDVSAGAASLLATAMILGLPLWETFAGHGPGAGPLGFTSSLRTNWMVETALASTAVLGAVVHPRLGALVVPFLLLPLLAARSGLQGYRTVRTQHDQTVRAMSRLPEELGEVPAGHGQRTARLAVAVSRQLGTSPEELDRLTQAAQLHELGRIRHEPGEDHSERTIALNGSNILQQAGLQEAARIVGAHRDHVLGTDPSATVLRLACELDLALGRTPDPAAALRTVAAKLVDPDEQRLLRAFDVAVLEGG